MNPQSPTHKSRIFVFALIIIFVIAGIFFMLRGNRSPQASMPTPVHHEPEVVPGYLSTTDATSGLSFQYPPDLGATYIHAQSWPPTLTLSDKSFSCVESNPAVENGGQVRVQTINTHQYCVTTMSEGAAGSIYTTYDYAFPYNGKTATFEFILRMPQCGNYDDPQKSACQSERNAFDIGKFIDTMAGTVR